MLHHCLAETSVVQLTNGSLAIHPKECGLPASRVDDSSDFRIIERTHHGMSRKCSTVWEGLEVVALQMTGLVVCEEYNLLDVMCFPIPLYGAT